MSEVTSSAISIRIVSWNELWKSGRDMMEAHSKEFSISELESYIGPHSDLLAAESEGNLIFAEAFDSSSCPVGYIAWKIGHHQGLATSAAHMGPWYVTKPYRGTPVALQLYKRSLESLKYRGCRYALTVLPIRDRGRKPNSNFGVPFETTYLKALF